MYSWTEYNEYQYFVFVGYDGREWVSDMEEIEALREAEEEEEEDNIPLFARPPPPHGGLYQKIPQKGR